MKFQVSQPAGCQRVANHKIDTWLLISGLEDASTIGKCLVITRHIFISISSYYVRPSRYVLRKNVQKSYFVKVRHIDTWPVQLVEPYVNVINHRLTACKTRVRFQLLYLTFDLPISTTSSVTLLVFFSVFRYVKVSCPPITTKATILEGYQMLQLTIKHQSNYHTFKVECASIH